MTEHENSPVILLEPRRFADARGWFMETWNARKWSTWGVTVEFVQDNHSYSEPRHTLRGLHFQTPPHAQDKLVRCLRGRILDVAVDVRGASPTYGQWVGAVLDDANARQLFVPAGFAHGFTTLTEDCEVAYKVSDFYAPECDGGIRWNDPTVSIGWNLPGGQSPMLSDKDEALPFLADWTSPFDYDGRPLQSLGPGHMGSL